MPLALIRSMNAHGLPSKAVRAGRMELSVMYALGASLPLAPLITSIIWPWPYATSNSYQHSLPTT